MMAQTNRKRVPSLEYIGSFVHLVQETLIRWGYLALARDFSVEAPGRALGLVAFGYIFWRRKKKCDRVEVEHRA